MAYEHLISNTPIPRQLEYAGKTETVYFKHMNAGERMALKKGQRGSVKAGESSFEVDLGDMDDRNHRFLYFVNCDEQGKRVFRQPAEVAALPASLVDKLYELATDALNDEPTPGKA